MAAGAITETDIRSYQLNRGVTLSCWDIDVLRVIDGHALESMQEKPKPKPTKGKPHGR